MNKGDRVAHLDVGTGTILSVRNDDRGVPILTIKLDDATQTPDGWMVAREWEVLNEFQWAMLRLDCALTGHTAREVAQQMHHKAKTPEEWFTRSDNAWYLSDGGYSRVCLMEDLTLYLTSNSLDKPKAAWDSCAGLRADIETLVRQKLNSAGELHHP